MDPNQTEVLDAGQIADLRGVDDAAFARVVNIYLTRTAEKIPKLRADLAAKNYMEIAKSAHTLRGSSGSLGAARVADVCLRIEKAGKTQDAAPLEELMLALEKEFGRARDALLALTGPGNPARHQ